jgi:hypothetical protein
MQVSDNREEAVDALRNTIYFVKFNRGWTELEGSRVP